jgi:hypothetical protein
MAREETKLVIKQVNAENFDDFLSLIDKLAEYEKLDSPNQEAKRRLRQDCLSGTPKFQAFIGRIGVKIVSTLFILYVLKFSCPSNSLHRRHFCSGGVQKTWSREKRCFIP